MKIIAAFLTLLSFCSCIGTNEYQPVSTYDLGIPAKGPALKIGNINLGGPFNSRMLFRQSGGRIDVREYERWSQAGDALLSSYLMTAFEQRGDWELNANLLAFENDLEKGQALLIIDLELFKDGREMQRQQKRYTSPCGADGASFATAMRLNLEALSRDLEKSLN